MELHVTQDHTAIKVDLHNSLPLEKTMTLDNVIILVKSVWNKDKNNYYYNIFLEKSLSFCINTKL